MEVTTEAFPIARVFEREIVVRRSLGPAAVAILAIVGRPSMAAPLTRMRIINEGGYEGRPTVRFIVR